MSLVVYGSPVSTCTRKVLCTLHELGLEHRLEIVDLTSRQQKSEAHLRRQPFGKIPALDDDGFELFESRTIARYLIDQYGGGKLQPADAKGRGVMNLWIDVESAYFTPHAMTFIYEHLLGRPQGEEALAAARTALAHTLGVLDARLAQAPYLAGEDFSLADVVYMPYLQYLQSTPAFELVKARANVLAWWQRVAERPSWKKATGG